MRKRQNRAKFLSIDRLEIRALLTATITDIGSLNGSPTTATGINSSGEVVGFSTGNNNNGHAFVYSNGAISDLGTIDNFGMSKATGINNNGVIVGTSNVLEPGNRTTTDAFTYSNGQFADISEPAVFINTNGNAINASGEVVGVANLPYGNAFSYNGGTFTTLPSTYNPTSTGDAEAINNSGEIVGHYQSASTGGQKGVIFENGQALSLSTSLYNVNDATSINSAGDIVGSLTDANRNSFAFLYKSGVFQTIGTSGYTNNAYGVNDLDQVVGTSTLQSQSNPASNAFLFSNGTYTDLNTLLPQGSGWTLFSAVAINDNGQIAGTGIHNGQVHAYLLDIGAPTLPLLKLDSVSEIRNNTTNVPDANNVDLDYSISDSPVTQPLRFDVYQSATPTNDASSKVKSILLGTKIIPTSDTADLSIGPQVITIPLNDTAIAPDPTRPYIVAVANADNSVAEGTGSVNTVSTENLPPYTPDDIRAAYDLPSIAMLPSSLSGAGQTIAIVDDYNDPTLFQDVNTFSSTFGLPQFGATNGPNLAVFDPTGIEAVLNGLPVSFSANLPPTDPPPTDGNDTGWADETALDVEWAHAIAPDANIDVVDVFPDSAVIDTNRLNAASVAGGLPGVSVVSMSFKVIHPVDEVGNEDINETSYDNDFVTPGVTYIAASGDTGSNNFSYPAASPNVLSVGGTTLMLDPQGSPTDYSSYQDLGFDESSGGFSMYESEPQFQTGYGIQSDGKRAVPDVSFDADATTGVYAYNSTQNPNGPWELTGGTSLGAPAWAGLIAIANQQRAAAQKSSLTGNTQTLPALYSAPPENFIDVVSQFDPDGGYKAAPGYDEVTGLGSPIAGNLIPYLAAYQPVTLSTNRSLTATIGVAVNQSITATGGSGHSTLIITPTWTTYPQGINFATSDNLLKITGAPAMVGTFTFNVTATDPFGSTDTEAFTLTINPSDVTADVGLSESGLLYSRASQLFAQTITFTNDSVSDFFGTLDIFVDNLPSGVTLADASGTSGGNPYVAANLKAGMLVPGQSFSITIYFADPNKISFSDDLDIYDV